MGLRILSFGVAAVVYIATLPFVAHAQEAPLGSPDTSAAPLVIRQMVGTWEVQQRMWTGARAEAIDLPPAVARRRLVGGAFLEEVMTLVGGSKQNSFTRVAHFNYNAVSRQYEYVSIDTRGPRMMTYETDAQRGVADHGGIMLSGGSFVAPQWGDTKNVAFAYRLEIGQVERNRQAVRLYLRPQAGKGGKEFLAFQYVYTRRH